MKIQDEACRLFPIKMKAVDTDPGLHIKEIFFEWDIVFELEILFKLFRLEYEFLLEKIYQDGEKGNAADNIPDERGQVGLI